MPLGVLEALRSLGADVLEAVLLGVALLVGFCFVLVCGSPSKAVIMRLSKLGFACVLLVTLLAAGAGALCAGAGALGAMLVTAACGRTFSFT